MFAEIDWTRPWYDGVRPAFDALPAGGDGFIDAFNANAARLGLQNHRGQPIRFVPQAALPPGTAYEAHIGATGCVPTRDNLHDFFNGLVWQTFPLIKRELNALQAAQIEAAGVGRARGPARDAATIFDENAALLLVRDSDSGRALVEDLRAHRWREALFDRRSSFERDAQPWLFGHALMEKPGAVLAGVGSRTLADAQAFAQTFGGAAYGSYEELVAADDVDLVYVGTPHPLHVDNVRLALNAGKGVLCEKPFTMNRLEAEELVAL